MPPPSAGILLYRRAADTLSVLLVLPGGPYWRNRDAGAWQIPKGAIEAGEQPEDAARREVAEELGIRIEAPLIALGPVRQSGGKIVHGFAIEHELDPADVVSNTFELEWPPRSGRIETYPEVERAAWFTLPEAREKMLTSQSPLLDRLAEHAPAGSAPPPSPPA
jgi:predicted NUDIX family NTP pyrophosphohydrolase